MALVPKAPIESRENTIISSLELEFRWCGQRETKRTWKWFIFCRLSKQVLMQLWRTPWRKSPQQRFATHTFCNPLVFNYQLNTGVQLSVDPIELSIVFLATKIWQFSFIGGPR